MSVVAQPVGRDWLVTTRLMRLRREVERPPFVAHLIVFAAMRAPVSALDGAALFISALRPTERAAVALFWIVL